MHFGITVPGSVPDYVQFKAVLCRFALVASFYFAAEQLTSRIAFAIPVNFGECQEGGFFSEVRNANMQHTLELQGAVHGYSLILNCFLIP